MSNTTFGRDDVEVVSSERGYDGFFKIEKIGLRHRQFCGGWSQTLSRELFSRGHAVGVLLFDSQKDAVVLVEQFRIGAIEDEDGPWMLELVAGMVKEGELPSEVAMRECLEECGREPLSLTPVSRCYLSPGGCSEQIEIFCGEIDSGGMDGQVHGVEGEGEDIAVRVLSVEDALAQMRSGKINNASTIIALQWLERERIS